ncbi:dockerin type I domain-containing protein, partial [Candidatus Poribacteria bacterium]
PMLYIGTSLTVSNSIISHAYEEAIYVSSSANPVINSNSIINDTRVGLHSANTATIMDAQDNWWGDTSGPKHEDNPDGKGSEILGSVDYTPWLNISPFQPGGTSGPGYVLGDVSNSGKVDSADALLILQYCIGLIYLPDSRYPNFTLATADVSGNGSISPFDASLILRLIVGDIAEFPVENPQVAPPLAYGKSIRRLLPGPLDLSSDLVYIPIILDRIDSVLSGKLIFEYEPSILEFVSFASPLDSNGYSFACDAQERRIELVFAGISSQTVEGDLAHLVFRRVPHTTVDYSEPFSIAWAQLNEGAIPVELVPADISEQILIPRHSALLANYPNPFNPETWLPYQLAQDAQVTISIYDISGHLIRNLDLKMKSAGIYKSKERAAYWDGKNEDGDMVSSGVYFYAIRAGALQAVRKMLLVK